VVSPADIVRVYTAESPVGFQHRRKKQKGAGAPFCFTNHQVNSVNLPKTELLVWAATTAARANVLNGLNKSTAHSIF
jgi:hypothetical protein